MQHDQHSASKATIREFFRTIVRHVCCRSSNASELHGRVLLTKCSCSRNMPLTVLEERGGVAKPSHQDGGASMAEGPTSGAGGQGAGGASTPSRATLGLTGLTINAMAL